MRMSQQNLPSPTFDRVHAASFLGISVTSLDRLARQGRISQIKLGVGRKARVLYRQRDLERFLVAHLRLAVR